MQLSAASFCSNCSDIVICLPSRIQIIKNFASEIVNILLELSFLNSQYLDTLYCTPVYADWNFVMDCLKQPGFFFLGGGGIWHLAPLSMNGNSFNKGIYMCESFQNYS